MVFWLKSLHIAAMLLWFAGMVFLARLLLARARGRREARAQRFDEFARVLYLYLATPAAVATIVLGMALIATGPQGAWLVMKLALVMAVVLLHIYLGVVLYRLRQGDERHGRLFYAWLGWLPVLAMLAIAALTGAKPASVGDLPPPPPALGGE